MFHKPLVRKMLDTITAPRIAEIKIDSRFMLPLEVFVGLSTILWGIVGGLLDGSFHELLFSNAIADNWFVMLVVLGAVQAGVGMFVLIKGHHWDGACVYRSVSVRTLIAALSTVCWSSVAATLISIDHAKALPWLLIFIPSIAFNGICFYINLQVRTVLDDRIPTKNLVAKLTRTNRIRFSAGVAGGGVGSRSGGAIHRE